MQELGIDGAVAHYKEQLDYYKNNLMYENSWLHISVNEMIIDYIVTELWEQ